MFHPTYRLRSHRGCFICEQVARQRLLTHRSNLDKLKQVAASLRPPSALLRQGDEKQETPGPANPEVSTAPNLRTQIRRAASAQYDGRG